MRTSLWLMAAAVFYLADGFTTGHPDPWQRMLGIAFVIGLLMAAIGDLYELRALKRQ